MRERLSAYVDEMRRAALTAVATDRRGERTDIEATLRWTAEVMHQAHDGGKKIIFVGNGGSAGISSHLAIDYTKNGGLRSLAFNDGAALTCLGNDLGYEYVFAKQIEMHGRTGDVLVAISSSGRSPNILKAVSAAREAGLVILTLSGFGSDNPLRRLGDYNIYVASGEYGIVEVTHLALCHAILDFDMGWQPNAQTT